MQLFKQKTIFCNSKTSVMLNNWHLRKTIIWLENENKQKKIYIIPNEINIINNKYFLTFLTYKYFYYKFCILYAILLRNNIYGYLRNFKNYLLIKGLGYKVKLENNILNFKLGYSHNILYPIPEGISINILPKKLKALKIVGSDCQLVKEVSIRIKNFKKPNSYKVQGIFFYKEKKKLKDSKKKSR